MVLDQSDEEVTNVFMQKVKFFNKNYENEIQPNQCKVGDRIGYGTRIRWS
jgi:hypothetical protein